jgi:hypothetical protein
VLQRAEGKARREGAGDVHGHEPAQLWVLVEIEPERNVILGLQALGSQGAGIDPIELRAVGVSSSMPSRGKVP